VRGEAVEHENRRLSALGEALNELALFAEVCK